MNQRINFEKPPGVTELSSCDLAVIIGGSGFWEDVAYVFGATAHFLAYMLEDAHKNPIRPSEYR
jgi:hypothetical protein